MTFGHGLHGSYKSFLQCLISLVNTKLQNLKHREMPFSWLMNAWYCDLSLAITFRNMSSTSSLYKVKLHLIWTTAALDQLYYSSSHSSHHLGSKNLMPLVSFLSLYIYLAGPTTPDDWMWLGDLSSGSASSWRLQRGGAVSDC